MEGLGKYTEIILNPPCDQKFKLQTLNDVFERNGKFINVSDKLTFMKLQLKNSLFFHYY